MCFNLDVTEVIQMMMNLNCCSLALDERGSIFSSLTVVFRDDF